MNGILGEDKLDKEWEELILSALEIGISVEEIKDFFNQCFRPK
jgi:hypothetical protein